MSSQTYAAGPDQKYATGRCAAVKQAPLRRLPVPGNSCAELNHLAAQVSRSLTAASLGLSVAAVTADSANAWVLTTESQFEHSETGEDFEARWASAIMIAIIEADDELRDATLDAVSLP